LITKARNSNKNINSWANFIKHKGGINYIGSTPRPRYTAKIILLEGTETRDDEFDAPNVNLEEVILELERHHILLCDILNSLVDFIGFEKVNFTPDGDNLVFPDENEYKKVIFNAGHLKDTCKK
jgi:hypothetical protein